MLICSTDWSECGIRVCSVCVLLCVVVLCYHELYSVIMCSCVLSCVIHVRDNLGCPKQHFYIMLLDHKRILGNF